MLATHTRFEHHMSPKFQGIKCSGISYCECQIKQLDEANGTYLVNSQTERGVKYLADVKPGVCSCNVGQDGSPCCHQAAILRHFHIPNINCIPTLSPETRQHLAMIAIGLSRQKRSWQIWSGLYNITVEILRALTIKLTRARARALVRTRDRPSLASQTYLRAHV